MKSKTSTLKAKSKRTPQKSSKKNSSRKIAEQLVKSVWPQERDYFERPERYKYVRKLLPQTGCVFCEASKMGAGPESLILVQDKLTIVIMNKYPYNSGHLLILPRKHVANLWNVDSATLSSIAKWQQTSVKILNDVLNCQGFNLGMNQGAVAGAGIPDHLHWHIVPRWSGDTNFFPLIAETKALPETLETTYSRLQLKFRGVK